VTAWPDTPSLPRGIVCDNDPEPRASQRTIRHAVPDERHPMSKRARKRRSRKGNKANHGRKPNA
jgi:hypothetical protein